MALNKVNIEFLRKQMDKVLVDIEKLKDANREMSYCEMVTHNDRVVVVTYVYNGEIKEARIQPIWLHVYVASVKLRDLRYHLKHTNAQR